MRDILFLDTNVVIDGLASREPFVQDTVRIFSLADLQKIELTISALTIPNCGYILRRFLDKEEIIRRLQVFQTISGIVPLTSTIINNSFQGPSPDFEDNIQYYSALEAGASIILTRDVNHFRNSKIQVISPSECLSFR